MTDVNPLFTQVADALFVVAVVAAPIWLGWVAFRLVRNVFRQDVGIDPRLSLFAAAVCLSGAAAWLSIAARFVGTLIPAGG